MGLFKQHEKWKNFNGNINIYEDLDSSDLAKLLREDHIHSLQFYRFKNPARKTWEVLNEFYRANPQFGHHIFWHDPVDFSFLDYIPSVSDLSVTSFLTTDFTPLLKMTNLQRLRIGETKSTSIDLSFISEFKSLKSLYIDGMKKGLQCIAELLELQTLTLRGIKLANLDFITGLKNLGELHLLFGSYKNLEAISTAKNLRTLEMSRTRQIPNYYFLNSLESLDSLCFEGMSTIEVLPDLSGLKNLKKIRIDNNSRLRDISSLEQLDKLEQLVMFFPENFKAELRKTLIIQLTKILLESNTIKMSTLLDVIDEQTKIKLTAKGIDSWNYAAATTTVLN